MNDKNTLVAFFSASGVTAKVAAEVARAVDGDLFQIVPTEPYTEAELNWHDSGSRSSLEMNDPASRPSIVDVVDGMDGYGTLFIGFPIWWHVAPRIIQTFLESYDLSDKRIVLFATSGSCGIGDTEKVLRPSCSDSTEFVAAEILSSSASSEEIKRWIDGLPL